MNSMFASAIVWIFTCRSAYFIFLLCFDLSVVARMVSCSKLSLWNVFVLSCRPLRLFSTRPTLIAPSRKLFDIVHRVWNFSKNWTLCSESLWHCTTHCVWNVVSGIVVSSHCFHMGVTNFAPHHVVCFYPQISSWFHLVHFYNLVMWFVSSLRFPLCFIWSTFTT